MPDMNRRDREVLSLLADGLSDSEIGRALVMGPQAVANCLKRISEAADLEASTTGALYERGLKLRAENGHRSLEARFKALMELSSEAVLVVNGRTGQIVQANEQAEKLFGISVGHLVGQSVESLVPEEFRTIHPAYRLGFLASIRKREIGHHPPIFALRSDGTRIELAIALTATSANDDVMVVCTEYQRWLLNRDLMHESERPARRSADSQDGFRKKFKAEET